MKKVLIFVLALAVVPMISLAKDNKQDAPTTAQLGKEFDISVPANYTTGYSWVVYQIPKQVILTGISYKQSPECKKGAIGCGGNTTFSFKAIKKGKGNFVIQQTRIFDKQTEPKTIKVIKVD